MELPNNPMRWDIINYLIEKYNYRSLIEIGFYKGWNIDRVNCEFKVSVDPNPCKTEFMEKNMEYGDLLNEDNLCLYKLTSDDYFKSLEDNIKNLPENASVFKSDIFFIDGLHEYKQVYRDIQNALKYLNEGGIILLHDCNPPTYQHTTTGVDGNWNGDCYKALLQFIQNDPLGYYSIFTINTDWGIGVIKPHQGALQPLERHYSVDYNKAINDWDYFDKNRNKLLNIISVETLKNIF